MFGRGDLRIQLGQPYQVGGEHPPGRLRGERGNAASAAATNAAVGGEPAEPERSLHDHA
jgi:hypothetical protein